MTLRAWMRRAWRMTAADYVTAVEIIVLAVWVEAAFAVMPFSRLLERLRRRSRSGSMNAIAPLEYARLERFVAVAYDVLPFRRTCLRQSLVLHALLERRGVPSRVCVGVAKDGASLDAHAWIECGGVDGDAAAARFSELDGPGIRPRL